MWSGEDLFSPVPEEYIFFASSYAGSIIRKGWKKMTSIRFYRIYDIGMDIDLNLLETVFANAVPAPKTGI